MKGVEKSVFIIHPSSRRRRRGKLRTRCDSRIVSSTRELVPLSTYPRPALPQTRGRKTVCPTRLSSSRHVRARVAENPRRRSRSARRSRAAASGRRVRRAPAYPDEDAMETITGNAERSDAGTSDAALEATNASDATATTPDAPVASASEAANAEKDPPRVGSSEPPPSVPSPGKTAEPASPVSGATAARDDARDDSPRVLSPASKWRVLRTRVRAMSFVERVGKMAAHARPSALQARAALANLKNVDNLADAAGFGVGPGPPRTASTRRRSPSPARWTSPTPSWTAISRASCSARVWFAAASSSAPSPPCPGREPRTPTASPPGGSAARVEGLGRANR